MRWILSTTISVFRCLEVRRGAHKKNNQKITRRMAQEFLAVHEIPNAKVGLCSISS